MIAISILIVASMTHKERLPPVVLNNTKRKSLKSTMVFNFLLLMVNL